MTIRLLYVIVFPLKYALREFEPQTLLMPSSMAFFQSKASQLKHHAGTWFSRAILPAYLLPTWTCALLKTLLGIRPVIPQHYSHTRTEKKMSQPRRYAGDRCLGYPKHSQPSHITPGLLVRQTPCITEYYNWVYQLAM